MYVQYGFSSLILTRHKFTVHRGCLIWIFMFYTTKVSAWVFFLSTLSTLLVIANRMHPVGEKHM